MKVDYCAENNPLTCVVQTIFGLVPFGSLFYFYWITNKFIIAEGFTQQIPPYTKSHIYKLIGSALLGIFSLVRVILEITQNEDTFVILSYVIYVSFILISVLLTYIVRQEYIQLGYTTPFVRTFLLLFETCYAIMLILSEIFPGGESVNGFTAKEALQIIILVDVLILGIICFVYKSDTKNPSHADIADLGFKLKKKYESGLNEKLIQDSEIRGKTYLQSKYLRKSITSEYLSQDSLKSQEIKTIQSHEFSQDEIRDEGFSKIKLENVGVHSIKVLFQERKKDPSTNEQTLFFKIKIFTKTNDCHETIRRFEDFLDYFNQMKSFLISIKYVQDQVNSFKENPQNSKDKKLIGQLTQNIGMILKYIVQNELINSHFYELVQSNNEKPLNQEQKPYSVSDDTPNKNKKKENKSAKKGNKSDIQNDDTNKRNTSEQNVDISKEIGKIQQESYKDQIQQVQDINKDTNSQESNSPEPQKNEQEKQKPTNLKSNEERRHDLESQKKIVVAEKNSDQDDIEESKENSSDMKLEEMLRRSKDFPQKQNEYDRSVSYHVSRDIKPIENKLKYDDEESGFNNLQRTQSIFPENNANNLIRASMKVGAQNEQKVQSSEPTLSIFFAVQFVESKLVDNYAVYVFKIRERQSGWETIIEKRYSQFEKLHSQLKPIAKGNKNILPSLPYKSSDNGIFTSSRDATLIKYRSQELKKYLQRLLLDRMFNKESAVMIFIEYEKETKLVKKDKQSKQQ